MTSQTGQAFSAISFQAYLTRALQHQVNKCEKKKNDLSSFTNWALPKGKLSAKANEELCSAYQAIEDFLLSAEHHYTSDKVEAYFCKPQNIDQLLTLTLVEQLVNPAQTLTKYCDPNYAEAVTGRTHLHQAALTGNYVVCKMLLARGMDIDVENRNGVTPLHRAAEKGHLKITTLFTNHGADLDAQTHDKGYTALHYAAKGNHVYIIEHLLSLGADPIIFNDQDESPADLATCANIRALLEV